MILDHTLVSKVTSQFKQNIQFMKNGCNNVISKYSGFAFRNERLKNAATRVVVPEPFLPFVETVESKLGIKFPSDLTFTKEEVLNTDREIISTFSKSNFDYSKLNLNWLVIAAIQAAKDLNIMRPDGKKYTVLQPEESIEYLPTSTSSGYPLFKKKSDVNARNQAIAWSKDQLDSPKLSNILTQPTAVFHRFQYKIGSDLSNVVKKIRPIWGVAFAVLVYEGCFFRDMIQGCSYFNRLREVPKVTWGMDGLKDVSTRIITSIRSYQAPILSLDVKQFDSNVPSFMWALFYAIVPHCVDMPKNGQMHLKCLMAFGNYTPYCHNSNRLLFQQKGVPSGSTITSLFTSWVTRTVVNYAFLEYSNGKRTAGRLSHCLGDDCVVVLRGMSDYHIFSVYKRFGLPIETQKSAVSEYFEPFRFIGYVWDEENRPTESIQWYVAHLCLPSRFVSNLQIPVSVYQTFRCLSVVMNLFKGLQTFEYLIGWNDFIYKQLRQMVDRGQSVSFTYYGEDQRLSGQSFPLRKLIESGWEAF